MKNGTRICGTGGSLGTAAIMQDKAYFEVRLQQTGISSRQAYGAVDKNITLLGVWGLGLGTEKADLNTVPMGNNAETWVLCSDGCLRHNKEEIHRLSKIPQEGDTIVSIRVKCNLNTFYWANLSTRVSVTIMMNSTFT